jgi:hypothetical protein
MGVAAITVINVRVHQPPFPRQDRAKCRALQKPLTVIWQSFMRKDRAKLVAVKGTAACEMTAA